MIYRFCAALTLVLTPFFLAAPATAQVADASHPSQAAGPESTPSESGADALAFDHSQGGCNKGRGNRRPDRTRGRRGAGRGQGVQQSRNRARAQRARQRQAAREIARNRQQARRQNQRNERRTERPRGAQRRSR